MRPLRVLSPCEVSASELETGNGASYCNRCQTTVHDLTDISEARARALGLLYGSSARFCGRIRVDARGRGIFREEKRAMQALALAAVVGAAGCATVEPPPPLPTEAAVATATPRSPIADDAPPPATATAEPQPEAGRVVISESVGMIILQQVRFAPGNAVPPPESRPILDETAKVLLANEQIALLRVEGHADTNERQPEAIAKRRAAEVVAYLIAKGVPPDRLVAVGEGAKKPMADNVTAEGRAKNRRIELHVVR